MPSGPKRCPVEVRFLGKHLDLKSLALQGLRVVDHRLRLFGGRPDTELEEISHRVQHVVMGGFLCVPEAFRFLQKLFERLEISRENNAPIFPKRLQRPDADALRDARIAFKCCHWEIEPAPFSFEGEQPAINLGEADGLEPYSPDTGGPSIGLVDVSDQLIFSPSPAPEIEEITPSFPVEPPDCQGRVVRP